MRFSISTGLFLFILLLILTACSKEDNDSTPETITDCTKLYITSISIDAFPKFKYNESEKKFVDWDDGGFPDLYLTIMTDNRTRLIHKQPFYFENAEMGPNLYVNDFIYTPKTKITIRHFQDIKDFEYLLWDDDGGNDDLMGVQGRYTLSSSYYDPCQISGLHYIYSPYQPDSAYHQFALTVNVKIDQ